MEEEIKKDKTIFDLGLHETMFIEEKVTPKFSGDIDTKRYEVTRVPGGWVYSFEYPGFRQSPIVFVPFKKETVKKVSNAKNA